METGKCKFGFVPLLSRPENHRANSERRSPTRRVGTWNFLSPTPSSPRIPPKREEHGSTLLTFTLNQTESYQIKPNQTDSGGYPNPPFKAEVSTGRKMKITKRTHFANSDFSRKQRRFLSITPKQGTETNPFSTIWFRKPRIKTLQPGHFLP